MTTNWEDIDSGDTQVGWLLPLSERGDDVNRPGQYSLTLAGNSVVAINGTPAELKKVLVALDEALQLVENHAAAPLTIESFTIDEDGDYRCPRCDDFFQPSANPTLAMLLQMVQTHVDKHNA